MAHHPAVVALLKPYGAILNLQDAAEVLAVTIKEVRQLSSSGAFEIFTPEADPDEECILRDDLASYIECDAIKKLEA
jgi:hypothetical protein